MTASSRLIFLYPVWHSQDGEIRAIHLLKAQFSNPTVLVFDLATDETSRKVIAEFASKGKVVAAVCHGPAAFVNVTLPDGSHLLQGKEVTGFSNAEEDTMKLSEYMPFLLETKLNEVSGGKFVKAGEQWGEKVVVAGKVITGQNPASAHKVGEEVVKAIGA